MEPDAGRTEDAGKQNAGGRKIYEGRQLNYEEK